MNAAIEAAARAMCAMDGLDPEFAHPYSEPRWVGYVPSSFAAIIAFLRNCEISEGVISTGGQALGDRASELTPYALNKTLTDHLALTSFKTMAAQLATELEGK